MSSIESSKRIYLDHAATSFPKPEPVLRAVQNYLTFLGASAGRGAYREAYQAKNLLDETREKLIHFFNASDRNRMLFTMNATEGLNLALKGILRPGDHVVVSNIEHNSVSRPLMHLNKTIGVTYTFVPVSLDGEVDWKVFEQAFQAKTKLVVFIHGSNVSGTLSPLCEIGKRTRQKGVPLLVDAAQTAGVVPIDVEKMNIDLLAFPGHKGLLAPLGTGGLWVRPGIELETLKEGGTGSFSEEDEQPESWPDRHESGSHNLAGIVGLHASLDWILEKGIERIYQNKILLMKQFQEGLRKIPNVRIVAPEGSLNNAGVFSLFIEGKSAQQVALELDERFRVQVRPGLHCAPWAHRSFGTYPHGTVRFSLGFSNSSQEIEQTLSAIREVV